MPEGDSIFHLATHLKPLLEGRQIIAARSGVVEVDETLVRGATVLEVTSRGKNLLIHLSTRTTLHTHLLMEGRVRTMPRRTEQEGGPRKTSRSVRLVVSTDSVDVLWIDTQVLRLLWTDKLDRDPKLRRIGPDPLRGEIDAPRIAEAMMAKPKRSLGETLLDQKVLAGLGNVLKSETMFCAGADPFAPVALYDPRMLAAIAETGVTLLRVTTDPRIVRALARPGRVTRLTEGALRGRGSRVWVYDRSGEECFVCGTKVRMKEQGFIERRSTYWCETCQPERTSVEQLLVAPAVGPLDRVRPG